MDHWSHGSLKSSTPTLQHSSTPSFELISIGDRVRPGRYTVHSRFRRVTNFIHGSELVFLAEESVGGGPLTLLARGADLPAIDRLEISDERLATSRETILLNGIARYISSVEWEKAPAQPSRAKIEELKRRILLEAHPGSMAFLLRHGPQKPSSSEFDRTLAQRLTDGARLLQNALAYNHPTCLARGIQTLKGCGKGLTPSGDDYLAGCLTALHSIPEIKRRKKEKLIRRIEHLSEGNNPLTNAFLRMAGECRLFEPMKLFIEAFSSGGKTELAAGVRRILAHGETSGADWATGFVMTLESMTLGRNN